jgi:hypothetical protein
MDLMFVILLFCPPSIKFRPIMQGLRTTGLQDIIPVAVTIAIGAGSRIQPKLKKQLSCPGMTISAIESITFIDLFDSSGSTAL